MLIDRLLFLCIVVFAISIISEINLHRKRSFPMYVDKNKTRQVRTLFNNYLLKSRNFTLVLFLGSIIGSIILLFLGAKLNISKIEIFLGLSILSYIILYISSLGLYDIIKKGYLRLILYIILILNPTWYPNIIRNILLILFSLSFFIDLLKFKGYRLFEEKVIIREIIPSLLLLQAFPL